MWKPDHDTKPRLVVGDCQLGVMEGCNGPNEGKTQSGSGSRAAAVKAIEPLEHLVTLVCRYALTAIGHGQHRDVALARYGELNPGSLRCMPDGIFDQICRQPHQEIVVAPDTDIIGDRGAEQLAIVFGYACIGI